MARISILCQVYNELRFCNYSISFLTSTNFLSDIFATVSIILRNCTAYKKS